MQAFYDLGAFGTVGTIYYLSISQPGHVICAKNITGKRKPKKSWLDFSFVKGY